MIKLVVFDLDNVLIDTETIDEIAKIKGIEEEISDITLQAMQGKIPFETSIRQRVKKLEGISTSDIDEAMDKISLNPGAVETATELKKQGYKIAIITGSFDVIALKVKELINADYAFYNTLEVDDGKLTGEVSGPLITQNKVDVLRQLVDEIGITLDECATIGDGANDLEMIKNAKIGIAYNAKPILKENADVQINEKDLRKVLDIMADEEKITKEEVVEETTQEPETITTEEEVKETEEVNEEEVVENDETEEETIDYSILNFQQLLQCKRTLESELTDLKNVRDKMNEETKAFRKERDELNQKLKDTLKIALDKRNTRDEINKEVHENKELRNQCNEELKKVEWNSGKKEISNIQAEINKIDKTIQTKVLDIRKENELVKRVSDLTKQLKKIQSDEEEEKTATQLKEKSELYHQKVVELSDKAQAVHEEMIEYFNKIDGIREEADGKHQDFINSRNAATAKHEEVKAKLSEIRKVNKFMDQAKSQSRGRKSEDKADNDLKEKEEAEEIFQKFKDGKKLTTDEFLLLQKYDIM
ncbi:phosphoserine phosphatase SerB [Methanosphaera stadtmanae]|uniref:phosphoserine phosphatase SerB n=1 Tax=Methanosphaera stadtmanae TaxID=2317 RepID=UPI002E75B177|nr:phosphoserine phosphatase SerB [Methanosphaera stadtmanae]MEE0489840.1 phosphoserine phosphatase SerB [Methanosphaera stadtmanae]